MVNKAAKPTMPFEQVVYILQGGGALGAYQAGVFKALQENHYTPNWIIGNSIGAINASIIAGNKPEDRVNKLNEFWRIVSKSVIPGYTPKNKLEKHGYNFLSGQQSIWFGLLGFFYPRIYKANFMFPADVDKISFYITSPLKETLNKVIDFKILNAGNIRLTLGAVEIESGEPTYFDNKEIELNEKHIMASCALPPGFPAIKIDDHYYWDEGILTNSPLERLMMENKEIDTLCFMMHLFESKGLIPNTLDGVIHRHKDIMYASHYLDLLHKYNENRQLKQTIREICGKLPEETQNSKDIKHILEGIGEPGMMHFAHFLYRSDDDELSSLDYDFSHISISRRLIEGYEDGKHAIKKSPWLHTTKEKTLELHELHSLKSEEVV